MGLFGISAPPTADATIARINLLITALDLQPTVGNTAQRVTWLQTLSAAATLTVTPPGFFATIFGFGDWNLRRASSKTTYVQTQATRAGLILSDPNAGLGRAAARFHDDAVAAYHAAKHAGATRASPVHRVATDALRAAKHAGPSDGATLHDTETDAWGSPAARMAGTLAMMRTPEERRKRFASEKGRDPLVRAFFLSEAPGDQALTARLEAAFTRHIEHHISRAALISEIAHSGRIPADAAYPRYFEDAESGLLDEYRLALLILNQGDELSLDWPGSRREMVSYLQSYYAETIGIDYDHIGGLAMSKMALRIAHQIYDYSAFQLLCLLIQVRNGAPVDLNLVRELRRTRDGRVIEFDMASAAGIRSSDILEASRLCGNIDIAHANRDIMTKLYMREHPGTSESAAWEIVRGQIARLAVATDGGSRLEYDGLVAQLKKAMD